MRDYSKITKEDGIVLVKTARSIVTEFLKTHSRSVLGKKFQDDFSFHSGVFVTLSNSLGLRGCIGYPLPNKKLFSALNDAAIAAATEDPRFDPIKYDELESILFEITILATPKKITVTRPEEILSEIKIGRDGLMIRNGFNSGLLLPQVPVEYGWTEKEFLERLCEKAGLPKDYWQKQSTEIRKFEAIIFKETPSGNVIQEEL